MASRAWKCLRVHRKNSPLQLRACHKVRHHLNLQNRDRTETNFDNELTTNNDNDNELQEEFCSFKLRRKSAKEIEEFNKQPSKQQLPTVTFKKKKKERLDNLHDAEILSDQLADYKVDRNFYLAASKTKLHNSLGVQLQLRDADSDLRGQLMRPLQRASTEACQEYRGFSLAASFRSRIDNHLPRKQLDRRDLQQDSFQDSSLTEETFSKTASKTAARPKRPSARQLHRQQLGRRELQTGNFSDSSSTEETFSRTTSQTAAWQKRASDRQLLRQQLERRDLHKGNFRDSSLEDETFSTATSKKAAWKRHFALATSQRAAWQLSLEQPSFQTRTSRTEPLEPQRRTSTTELSELERTALHTELAELERPALTTELAQLQTDSFDESSFELSFEEPSFTAQLCFSKASSTAAA